MNHILLKSSCGVSGLKILWILQDICDLFKWLFYPPLSQNNNIQKISFCIWQIFCLYDFFHHFHTHKSELQGSPWKLISVTWDTLTFITQQQKCNFNTIFWTTLIYWKRMIRDLLCGKQPSGGTFFFLVVQCQWLNVIAKAIDMHLSTLGRIE